MTIEQYTDTAWQLAGAAAATMCSLILVYLIIAFAILATRKLGDHARGR